MEAIRNNLSNPEWWFTVVFVGLIVSIVSNPIKNLFAGALGGTFKWFRRYSENQTSLRANEVSLLAFDTNLLIIEYIRATLFFIGTISLIGASFLMSGWEVLRANYPEVDPLNQLFSIRFDYYYRTFSDAERNLIRLTAFFIPSMYFWNRFLRILRICEEARLYAKDRAKKRARANT